MQFTTVLFLAPLILVATAAQATPSRPEASPFEKKPIRKPVVQPIKELMGTIDDPRIVQLSFTIKVNDKEQIKPRVVAQLGREFSVSSGTDDKSVAISGVAVEKNGKMILNLVLKKLEKGKKPFQARFVSRNFVNEEHYWRNENQIGTGGARMDKIEMHVTPQVLPAQQSVTEADAPAAS